MAGAEAKLGMSLDDIIKQNEKKRDVKSRPTIRAKPTLERGNATNVRVVPRPRGVTKRAPTSFAVTIPNVLNRSEKRGGTGRHPVTRKYIPRNEAQQAQAAAPVPRGNSNARWKHDLFTEEAGRASRAEPKGKVDGAKLLISNLDYGVTEADLVELFETIGVLKDATVKYDRSGRSMGEAEVTFTSRADARSAKEKYNNVLLDGQKMIIELEGGGGGGDVFSRLSTGPRNGAAAGRAGVQGSRIFQQATRSGGQTTRSSGRMSTRATGAMRGFQDDDDDMEE